MALKSGISDPGELCCIPYFFWGMPIVVLIMMF